MDEHEEEPTCGRGVAANAVVPSALAAVAAGIAQNLEAHLPSLDLADPAAAHERDVYERVAHGLRRGAADLRTAAEEMTSAAGLPMGPHDMAAVTTPEVLDAFERLVAAEDDLRGLLDGRRADNEQILTMIRSEVDG